MLVIFFMLSSTFVDEGRMKIQLPAASEAPQMTGIGRTHRRHRDRSRAAIASTNASWSTPAARPCSAAVLAVSGKESRAHAWSLRADARATHQAVVTAMDVLGKHGLPAARRGDHPAAADLDHDGHGRPRRTAPAGPPSAGGCAGDLPAAACATSGRIADCSCSASWAWCCSPPPMRRSRCSSSISSATPS